MIIAVICHQKRQYDQWYKNKYLKNQINKNDKYVFINRKEKTFGLKPDKIIELWGASFNPEYSAIIKSFKDRFDLKIEFEDW